MNIINIYTAIPDNFFNKFKYVVENVFNIYNVEIKISNNIPPTINNSQINIFYIYEKEEFNFSKYKNDFIIIRLKEHTLNYFSSFSPYDLTQVVRLKSIPFLFPDENEFYFPFDFFSASFFFLSCWQEYTTKEKDKKGRFLLKNTIQHNLGCVDKPLVNEYLSFLEDHILEKYGIRLEKRKIKNNSSKVALISHDIDHLNWSNKEYFKRLFYHILNDVGSITDLYGIVYNSFSVKRKSIFSKIAKISKKNGCEGTNFFLTDYPKSVSRELDNLDSLFGEIDFELGHHISDKSIYEQNLKTDLEKYYSIFPNNNIGERVHTLRFNVNELFEQIEEYNYIYESSLLFAENVGYRTGFTYPHYIYNPLKDTVFKTLSIAPNVMETTVFGKKYLNKNEKDGYNYINSFIKESMNYSGHISILFHHSFFWLNYSSRIKGFRKMIECLKENNIPFITHKELYFWHKENKVNIKIE